MALSKKTTVLFPPELHRHLVAVAAQRNTSLGELVRTACEAQYGFSDSSARVSAVEALADLQLPVAAVPQMKQESVDDLDRQ